jgi:hypothetical protein
MHELSSSYHEKKSGATFESTVHRLFLAHYNEVLRTDIDFNVKHKVKLKSTNDREVDLESNVGLLWCHLKEYLLFYKRTNFRSIPLMGN